jgi:hypothetical protein
MFVFNTAGMSATALQERVDEICRGLATPIRGAEATFGARLKDAVKARLSGQSIAAANAASEDETFGDKLRKAVQKHPRSKESAQKRTEKEAARYHKPTRRPATKSD